MENLKSRKPLVGISQCLLGESVRYDGGHKRHSLIMEELGSQVEWVPVCPEVEMGLPVPREAMILTGDPKSPRLMGRDSGKDYTNEMTEYCRQKVLKLKTDGLDGFIFKKLSPSCGVMSVSTYDDVNSKNSLGTSSGLFAAMVQNLIPSLPIVEESELDSSESIAIFIQRMKE